MCFKEVSKKFQGSVKIVSIKFQGYFKKRLKGVSRKIKVCFKEIFSGFQG